MSARLNTIAMLAEQYIYDPQFSKSDKQCQVHKFPSSNYLRESMSGKRTWESERLPFLTLSKISARQAPCFVDLSVIKRQILLISYSCNNEVRRSTSMGSWILRTDNAFLQVTFVPFLSVPLFARRIPTYPICTLFSDSQPLQMQSMTFYASGIRQLPIFARPRND